jgi:hypothetical protein
MAQSNQTLRLAMEEMQQEEFMAALSELTALCGFHDTPLKSAGSGPALKSAPARQLGLKVSSSDPPPMRYSRRTKSQ